MTRLLSFLLFSLFVLTGNPRGQTIFDVDTVLQIRMYFDFDNWHEVLDSLKQRGKDERVLGDLTVNGVRYEKVGIRYKGNSSYFSVQKSGSTKLPFNIDTDHVIDGQKLPGGYEKLKLSNVFRDPSFLREVLSYEIARKYMPASRANFAQVWVNDQYLGLYNCTEAVEDEFLEDYFDHEDGVLVKCDPIWGFEAPPGCKEGDKASLMYLGQDSACYAGLYEMKSKYGWKELIELARILKEEPERIEEVLNVDRALWMLAFDNVLVNLDSYVGRFCHNYYLYQDADGIFHPIVWDMNLSFGAFRYTGLDETLSNEGMQTMSPFIHYKEKNPKRPLLVELLANDLYRKIYVAHIKTIVEENFADSSYLHRAREIHAMIAPLVKSDSNKLYTYEAFQQNLHETARADRSSIIGLTELMGPRTEYLLNHPLLEKDPPLVTDVEHIDFGDIIAFNARIEGASRAWLFYRYNDYGAFKRLEMFDDSGHNDQMEGDGIWGATLEAGENIHYYVVAEGDRLAAVVPARASHEYFETRPETEESR